ncbi:DUF2971 domain-containing protein [Asticcacaulis sp.]|uniref:DUF2971 domain-containing protein n=1 Tax=Asticcacaulis sp. TaxID=1872648 RepID=UPI003F7B8027
MRLYYFTTVEHGLAAIRDQRLKIALIDKLNDPFELMIADLSHLEERRMFYKYKDQVASEVGILCLSDSWKNPTMWGHYAAKHTGICLGFDVAPEATLKVTYLKERLAQSREELRDEMAKEPEKFIDKLISHKHADWAYETEYRILCHIKNKRGESGLYFEEIGGYIKLAEVIIGHKSIVTFPEIRREIAKIAQNVGLFRADLHPTKYEMVANVL